MEEITKLLDQFSNSMPKQNLNAEQTRISLRMFLASALVELADAETENEAVSMGLADLACEVHKA